MKKYLLRSENIMLCLVILFFISHFLMTYNSHFNFYFFNEYFGADKKLIYSLCFVYALVIYFLYTVFRKINHTIPRLIVVIQISGLLFQLKVLLFNYTYIYAGMPRTYYDYSILKTMKDYSFSRKTLSALSIYFILSQVIFFGYFLFVLLKHLFKKS
jgi:hypothetical protein